MSVPTAKRWADRYREFGEAGHGRSVQPAGTALRSARRPASGEEDQTPAHHAAVGAGADCQSAAVCMPPRCIGSSCGYGLAAAGVCGPVTGQVVRRETPLRYEHDAPGDLVHVDIKKLGNIPEAVGGLARKIGRRNRQTHHDPARPRTVQGRPNLRLLLPAQRRSMTTHGWPTVEILPDDERPDTAAGVLAPCRDLVRRPRHHRATGPDRQRLLLPVAQVGSADGLNTDCVHKRTRPRRPQTNGKVERFNRTLLTEWAYARPYRSNNYAASSAALPKWLHIYNHHRAHTALGGQPPARRVTNLSGQNT